MEIERPTTFQKKIYRATLVVPPLPIKGLHWNSSV